MLFGAFFVAIWCQSLCKWQFHPNHARLHHPHPPAKKSPARSPCRHAAPLTARKGSSFPSSPARPATSSAKIGNFDGLEEAVLINSGSLLYTPLESVDAYRPGPEFSFGDNVNETTGRSGDELYMAYQQQYRESPNLAYLALAYDATTLLLHAVEEVAIADGSVLFIDRAKLREALIRTTGFNGIMHYTDPTVDDIAELPLVYRYSP